MSAQTWESIIYATDDLALDVARECYVQSSIEFRVLKLEFRALTKAGNNEYAHF